MKGIQKVWKMFYENVWNPDFYSFHSSPFVAESNQGPPHSCPPLRTK